MQKPASFTNYSTSCINTLPDDVLLEIFFHLCDEGIDVARPGGGVWHLRQICSRWRDLVHSTPLLWNKFCAVNLHGDEHRFYPSAVARQIQACLDYSHTAPLFITIIHLWGPVAANETLRRAIREIANHANRLIYLKIEGTVLQNLFEEATAATVQLPSLRTFSVVRCSSADAYRLLQGATSLEDVTIGYSKLPSVSGFPWASVKRLTISFANLDLTGESVDCDFSDLFDAMPHLEELAWRNDVTINWVSSQTSRRPPVLCSRAVYLPHLHSLAIEYSPELHSVIPMLRIPLLSSLTLKGQTDSDAVPFQRMIRKSGCCIKRLRVEQISSSVVVHVLNELADLEHIYLDVETMEEISVILASKAFALHSLQTIRIDAQNNESYDEAARLAGILIDALRWILSSRLSVSGSQNLLSLVECKVSVADDAYDTFNSMAGDLEELGEKLGVKLVLVPKRIDIACGYILVD